MRIGTAGPPGTWCSGLWSMHHILCKLTLQLHSSLTGSSMMLGNRCQLNMFAHNTACTECVRMEGSSLHICWKYHTIGSFGCAVWQHCWWCSLSRTDHNWAHHNDCRQQCWQPAWLQLFDWKRWPYSAQGMLGHPVQAQPLQLDPLEEGVQLEQAVGPRRPPDPLQEQSRRQTPAPGLRAYCKLSCNVNVCELRVTTAANNIPDAEAPTISRTCSATPEIEYSRHHSKLLPKA